jgi:hypothetical protein
MYNRWSSPNWKSLRFKTKITSIQIFHCSRSQEEVEPEESAAVYVWREPVSVDETFRPGAGAGGSPSTRSGTWSAASRGDYGVALVSRVRAAPGVLRRGRRCRREPVPAFRGCAGRPAMDAVADLLWDGSGRLSAAPESAAAASGMRWRRGESGSGLLFSSTVFLLWEMSRVGGCCLA